MLKKIILLSIIFHAFQWVMAEEVPAELLGILNKCQCHFEKEKKRYKDKKNQNQFLLATVLCDCGQIDASLAVACSIKNNETITPKQCALDQTIQISMNENKWPLNWPDSSVFEKNLNTDVKKEFEEGHGEKR